LAAGAWPWSHLTIDRDDLDQRELLAQFGQPLPIARIALCMPGGRGLAGAAMVIAETQLGRGVKESELPAA
jgi:hypothetical protein